ncbi:hypothetical protein AB1Y20_003520 [Prymnesium parvum]|uniref:Uncharacterized protein n=1 Tax=Prymnesium parvum TaxID=97485 RepID=A0AB34J781_PRYPA
MFKRILIANRGEIALRIMRTAQRLGVECVAVYSEADRDAQHVRLADAAVCLGGTASSDSYLRSAAVLSAALSTGAQAIHPGYGFLSENASFAEAVGAAGLTFIGPPADAMRQMGSKDAAKALMAAAGVPLLPGYHGEAQDLPTLRREALACGLSAGLPVLLKAVLGGGGKGMRVVRSEAELQPAVEGAQREARASFGDARLLVERYLPSARHIEVQVFCDARGGAVHLFERDCSVQRRHQKVLEEAPAPAVDAALRRQLGEAALRAARAVGYEGAGTVEFIADAADPSHFYFMEMNTRLQVEHPVTEMISGVDLVEWQLRVAAGEPLPLTQDQLTLAGHSFEARIYAEKPEAGFLPGSGPLTYLSTPSPSGETYLPAAQRSSSAGYAVRIDSGVVQGDEVSVFYDPMIAKLITRGPDRLAALRALQRALDDWKVVGLPTNVPFLKRILQTEAFREGRVHTAFIDEHKAELLPDVPAPPSHKLLSLAVSQWVKQQGDLLAAALPPGSVWARQPFLRLGSSVCGGAGASPLELQPLDIEGNPSGAPFFAFFRHAAPSPPLLTARADPISALEISISAEREAPPSEWTRLELLQSADASFRATLNGESCTGTAVIEPPTDDSRDTLVTMFTGGETYQLAVRDLAAQAHARLSAKESDAARQAAIIAPMPGKIVRLLVAPGQAVAEGEALVVLEAMKMEHTMHAKAQSVVAAIHAKEGDVVPQRALLVSFQDVAAAA